MIQSGLVSLDYYKWHSAFDPEFDTFQYMVWHKTNPIPKFRKAGFLNSCELILCMWNKEHIWNFGKQNEMHNFIETPICMGRERLKDPVHPTQKPLKVLKHIINIASNPGSLVFDPFMGVGSTGIASIELGRRFLGIELDKNYYHAAEKRFKDYNNIDKTPNLLKSNKNIKLLPEIADEPVFHLRSATGC